MMKKLFFALLSVVTMSAFAQIEVKTDGTVEVGTPAATGTDPIIQLTSNGHLHFDFLEPQINWNGNKLNFKSLTSGIPLIAVRGSAGFGGRVDIWGVNDAATEVRINSDGASYFNGGNVGIGTTTPVSKLGIQGGNIGSTQSLRIDHDLSTGSGVVIFNDINNTMTTSDGFFRVHQLGTLATSPAAVIKQDGSGDILNLFDGDTEVLTVLDGGNVGIGTTDTFGRKLAVNGEIIAQDMISTDSSLAWPDYVFEQNYKLKTLSEVEKHIEEKGHLPNIPSAKEVEQKGGVALGEMNKKLLEKVEELTLYLIEQNKQLKQQKEQFEKQNERIKALEQELKKLKQ